MTYHVAAAVLGVVVLAGCAATGKTPVGMKPGQFVTYECDAGKRFQARLAEDGSSVRIRYEGGYELDAKGQGVFESEGWKLSTEIPAGSELMHKGKLTHKNCKPV